MTTNIRNNRPAAAPRRLFGTTALILTCAFMVTAGFFVAAQQHFASMDYGMKNSRLRQQVEQLEAEKRRLMLAREISLSPTEIKKAVKKIGLGEPGREPAASASLASSRKLSPGINSAEKALVVKTVSTKPTQAGSSPAVKMVRGEKLDKKGLDAE